MHIIEERKLWIVIIIRGGREEPVPNQGTGGVLQTPQVLPDSVEVSGACQVRLGQEEAVCGGHW